MHNLEDIQDKDSWKLSEGPTVNYLLDGLLSRSKELAGDLAIADSRLPGLKKSLGTVGLYLSRIQESVRYREGETNERALLLRSLPLTAVDLQRQLRSKVAALEKNLTEVESNINVIKSRLARSGSSTAPSVQGIRESIAKMTELALRRRNEVQNLGKAIAERKAKRSGAAVGSSGELSPGNSRSQQHRNSINRQSIISEIDFVSDWSRRQIKVSVVEAIRNRPKGSVIRKANIRHTKLARQEQ